MRWQVFQTESAFLIHHANGFEREGGEEIEVWSSGWGPEALRKLDNTTGMLGSWRVVLEGDFTGIPFTALWRHRFQSFFLMRVQGLSQEGNRETSLH